MKKKHTENTTFNSIPVLAKVEDITKPSTSPLTQHSHTLR